MLPAVLGTAGLLLLLALLRPVDAHPAADEPTIIPDHFAYLPHVAREPTPASTATPIPGVDLIVWDIVASPEAAVIGETIIITVSVKNQGGDDAPAAIWVWLSVDDERVWPDGFIAPLQSGDIEDIVWGLSTSSLGLGWHAAEAKVDPDNLIPETDEDNNILRQLEAFQVILPPQ